MSYLQTLVSTKGPTLRYSSHKSLPQGPVPQIPPPAPLPRDTLANAAFLNSLPLKEQLGEATQAHLCLQLVLSMLPLYAELAPPCRVLLDGVLSRQWPRPIETFASKVILIVPGIA